MGDYTFLKMHFFQFCFADFRMLISLEHPVFEDRSHIENKHLLRIMSHIKQPNLSPEKVSGQH